MACATGATANPVRSIADGCLVTVEERLETFKESDWPFTSGSCTPLRLAEAGFYYCEADTVRCFVCHKDLEGWEEEDEPWVEHSTHSKTCPFLKIKDPYTITVGNVVELEKHALKLYIKLQGDQLRRRLTQRFHETIENLKDSHFDQEN